MVLSVMFGPSLKRGLTTRCKRGVCTAKGGWGMSHSGGSGCSISIRLKSQHYSLLSCHSVLVMSTYSSVVLRTTTGSTQRQRDYSKEISVLTLALKASFQKYLHMERIVYISGIYTELLTISSSSVTKFSGTRNFIQLGW